MGASSAHCIRVRMHTESLSISCPTGAVSEVTHVGVYQQESEADERGLCTSDSYEINTGMDCSSISNTDSSFYKQKLLPCVG